MARDGPPFRCIGCGTTPRVVSGSGDRNDARCTAAARRLPVGRRRRESAWNRPWPVSVGRYTLNRRALGHSLLGRLSCSPRRSYGPGPVGGGGWGGGKQQAQHTRVSVHANANRKHQTHQTTYPVLLLGVEEVREALIRVALSTLSIGGELCPSGAVGDFPPV